MKLLHYLPRILLAEGGVVRAVLDLCAGLANAGHQVTLLCCDGADAPGSWREPNANEPRLVELGAPGRPAGFLSRPQMREAAASVADADLLHLHTPWITSNRQVARLAARAGKRYVLSLHGMLDDWSMARRRWKKTIYLAAGGRRLLDRAACILCTAEGEREQSAKRLPHGRVAVAPLVPDAGALGRLVGPDLALRELVAGDHSPIVLFLGRIFEDKGVEELIDAAGMLHEGGVSFQLVLAGPGEEGYLAALRRRAQRAGVADRVRWLGFVGEDRKQSLLEAADVAVSLSLHENFGFTVVEALACATPAVITRGVAIWPTLEEGGGVRVVSETREAADAIRTLLLDPALRLELGARARRHVLSWLAPDRVLAEYEAIYRRAMAGETTREAA